MNANAYKDLLRHAEIVIEQKHEKLAEYAKRPDANPKLISELTSLYNLFDRIIEESYQITQEFYLKGLDTARRQMDPRKYGSPEDIRARHLIDTMNRWKNLY